ncbi:MAG: DUF4390 domain-containing protein [Desulfovibrio sp.]|jgi:hypothetical protein|nr:DUF4390 domain-containing protein [Desulfovibrio sp.]
MSGCPQCLPLLQRSAWKGGKGSLALLWLFLLLCLAPPSPCRAASPIRLTILEPRLEERENTLFFCASLSVEEENVLHDLLKDGAVLELTAAISLERHRSWWTNAEVAFHAYASSLRLDQLTRDFLLSPLAEGKGELTRDRNLTRLLYGSWRQMALPAGDMEAIRKEGPGRDYVVTVSFYLRHTEVPPWLEKSLVFWSSEVAPEKTITLNYHYE